MELFRSLGDETRASKIEAQGCSWWWYVRKEKKGSNEIKVEEGCGVDLLPLYLSDFGARTEQALQDSDRSRTLVTEGMEKIARIEEQRERALQTLQGMVSIALAEDLEVNLHAAHLKNRIGAEESLCRVQLSDLGIVTESQISIRPATGQGPEDSIEGVHGEVDATDHSS